VTSIFSIVVAIINHLLSGGNATIARRENTMLKHMELLMEESQKEIAALRKENAELRQHLSEMQEEQAEMKAKIILLLNAVESLNASDISERAIVALRSTVKEALDNAKKPKVRKDVGA
jgi:cell shape-determining protein MreC